MRSEVDDKGKELEKKIEIVRERLHKKIENQADMKEILRVSENLDKLIVDYLKI